MRRRLGVATNWTRGHGTRCDAEFSQNDKFSLQKVSCRFVAWPDAVYSCPATVQLECHLYTANECPDVAGGVSPHGELGHRGGFYSHSSQGRAFACVRPLGEIMWNPSSRGPLQSGSTPRDPGGPKKERSPGWNMAAGTIVEDSEPTG